MAMTKPRSFCFYLSSDINIQVQVRVSDLELLGSEAGAAAGGGGLPPEGSAVYVATWLSDSGEARGQSGRTTWVPASPSGAVWGEWLQLTTKYRDLTSDAQLCFAVWAVCPDGRRADADVPPPPPSVQHGAMNTMGFESGSGGACSPWLLGGTTLPLFSKKGRLKTGTRKLKVWPSRFPCMNNPSSTPSKAPLAAGGQLAALRHSLERLQRGDMVQVPWLDPLTTSEVAARGEAAAAAAALDASRAATQPSMNLIIDLPSFPHAVLYQQPAVPSMVITTGLSGSVVSGGGVKGSMPHGAGSTMGQTGSPTLSSWSVSGMDGPGGSSGIANATSLLGLICLHDPEVGRDNPSELKAQKLARSLNRGVIDRDLKPNIEERRRIGAALRAPPNKPLSAEEQRLLWRFRFALQTEHQALPKFLQVVDWRDSSEARQAAELMTSWAAATTAEALELLSPTFRNIDEVRGHAVSVLGAKEDEELLSVLLQLVQALRYESSDVSRLSRFLVMRAAANPHFAITLHWYLATEVQDPQFGPRADSVLAQLYRTLEGTAGSGGSTGGTSGSGYGRAVCDAISRQRELLAQLKHVVSDLKSLRLKAARATVRMQEVMSSSGACGELTVMSVPLPLDPSLTLAGVIPSECFAFKSAQLPLRLHFRVTPTKWSSTLTSPPHASQASHTGHAGGQAAPSQLSVAQQLSVLPSRTGVVVQGDELRCCLIYKKGDDLRQDQFVLQMIGLMDRLLKRDNLDLRMTPYKVLPTSSDDGLLEFVPSVALSRVLAEHRTIRRFLQLQGGEDPQGPLGLRPDVLETFVRSAAGSCVVTYILGVGDRHLDNLLLCSDGRLFHIDFGYILGADPKPFPPPMKICKEMVEAMGGQDSPWYGQFRMYACEAYNILRKNADLLLSLFHLMEGASIEAIRADPEKALLKLQDKLRLDLDDEAAVAWMTGLLMESATALMPQIVETTHRWAQYWR